MGLFSSKPRGMTPAEEAARRRGVHIPDDAAANAAQAQAAHRAATAAPSAPIQSAPAFETKRIKLWDSGFLGTSHPDQKELERLLADGWEIVNKERYTRRPWYTLRRPKRG
ncbi:hypothetical protein PTQ19_10325 [Microbacterium esteraromaticum]|uniref:hypothetical protein n=1 Tax=Microbacterium esteraromaticum TaxID=57043 RepID=UPI0023677318|nr:hypothetical protein [Microbacterium esteraromaticum]WDH77917.1 hypothetical protein PTQ19_10325 [Microbacterium esteraromaticum]